ncbi:apocytochrome b [Rhizophagus irregularis DAOM 181602=DAOM 197198]|nr:apocytochrome b [Rhizophagus irregularis DAOM 181602=DAOM 197198]
MISPFDLLFTYCESTDVVLWRVNLPSNVGVSRFSPLISSIVNLSIPIKVGISAFAPRFSLDLHKDQFVINKENTGISLFFSFKQSLFLAKQFRMREIVEIRDLATVITNLLSAIPWIGTDLVEFPHLPVISLFILAILAGSTVTKEPTIGSNPILEPHHSTKLNSVLLAPQNSDILLQILLIAGTSSILGVGYVPNLNYQNRLNAGDLVFAYLVGLIEGDGWFIVNKNAALAFMHLIALHQNASNNPMGVSSKMDRVPFYPYYVFKDIVGFFVFFLILSIFVFFFPNALGHPDNSIPANPMQTPISIVPEFYLLPFYAILRAIPNKLLGVVAMLAAIFILFLLPYLESSRVRSSAFRPFMRIFFWLFAVNFLLLMWIGANHPEPPFILLGQLCTAFYFAYFLILVPLIGLIENTLSDLGTINPSKNTPQGT